MYDPDYVSTTPPSVAPSPTFFSDMLDRQTVVRIAAEFSPAIFLVTVTTSAFIP